MEEWAGTGGAVRTPDDVSEFTSPTVTEGASKQDTLVAINKSNIQSHKRAQEFLCRMTNFRDRARKTLDKPRVFYWDRK